MAERIYKNAKGRNIYIDDANNGKIRKLYGLYGDTEQETTLGNQLIDFNNLTYALSYMSYSFNNDTVIVSNSSGRYMSASYDITDSFKNNAGKTLKFSYESADTTNVVGTDATTVVQLNVTYTDNTKRYIMLLRKDLRNQTYQIPSDTSDIQSAVFAVYSNNSSTDGAGSITIVKPMLQFGTEEKEYEEYTGGQPAPNPDFPMPVRVVTGNNTIRIEGKNLFDKSNDLSSAIRQQAQMSKSGSGRECNLTKTISGTISPRIVFNDDFFEVNTTYYISFKIKGNWNNFEFGTWINNRQVRLSDIISPTNQYQIVTGYFTYPANKTSEDRIYFRNTDEFVEIGQTLTITDFMISKINDITYEPYQSQEYKVDLPVKNLWGNVNYSVTDSGLTYTYNNEGTITANGTSNGTPTSITVANAISNNIFVTLPQGTYTVSCKNLSNYGRLQVYTTNSVGLVNSTTGEETFTLNETTSVILRLQLNSGITLNNYKFNLQLEEGSKANSYTPYGTTPIELCKIGDYQDYIYKNNGKWYKHKKIGKVVLNGTENWHGGEQATVSTDFRYIYMTVPKSISANKANIKCNYLPSDVIYISAPVTKSSIGTATSDTNNLRVLIDKTLINNPTTNEEARTNWATWLSTHNTEVYYGLADEVDEEITNDNLLLQLNALESADLVNMKYFTSNGSVVDSPIDLEYWTNYYGNISVGVNDTLAPIKDSVDSNTASIQNINVDLVDNYATKEELSTTDTDTRNWTTEQFALINQTVNGISIDVTTIKTNGVDQVTTGKGFTFNDQGLHIENNVTTDVNATTNNLDEEGMYVRAKEDNSEILGADTEGVRGKNITARTYLIVGDNSRFENYLTTRTGCFYIGGNE